MKGIKSLSKYLLAALFLVTVNNSCTDLEEQLYSEVPSTEADAIFAKLTAADIQTAVQSAYDNLAGNFGNHNGTFSDNEVSTDEMIIPQRGGDWYDGGQWLRMHQHGYTKNEDSFNNSWNSLYRGISICNRLIVQIPKAQPQLAGPLVAELRALRAFYYFYLMDMWGNVPIFTKWPGDIAEANAKKRSEIYTFVESELNAVVGALSDKADASTNGRMNKFAAQSLLAKLYLNAGVYKGAPEWAKCVTACDAVINSGKYSIEPDFKTNFWFGNEVSKENVMVIPFEPGKLGGFQIMQMTGHYETQKTFDLQAQPWNGYCTSAEFYNSFDANDKRKDASLLYGKQFASDGKTPLVDNGAESNDPDGKEVNFTPELNELFPGALRQAGARIGKYRPKNGSSPDLSNDFPIFRLGDIKLMKAEALWRQNAGDATALLLVNEIRTRAGATPFTTLSSDNLLAERGREVFAEGWRRNDMIRFGKFFKAYGKFKTADNEIACKGVFPILQAQIDANASLPQNECYK